MTNDATLNNLRGDFEADLIRLACNVHPIDGVANKARQVAETIDSTNDVKGACLGKEPAAVKVIKVLLKPLYLIFFFIIN